MVAHNVEAPPKSFINIGCGYDSHFSQFEWKGYTFINFDIVYDSLYTLQRNFGGKSCVAGDVKRLPFKSSFFDYVVCVDVIHHENQNIPSLLKSFRKLLKPMGCLFLEDPNAWGMFQFAKSILLPNLLYKVLRSIYHKLKHSTSRPAHYEFPTSVWYVKKTLEELGFCNIRIYANKAYPCIGPLNYQVYKGFSKIEWVQKYHNYHYMLSAIKSKE